MGKSKKILHSPPALCQTDYAEFVSFFSHLRLQT